ncbi:hypothetical protein AB8880_02130 [Alphaproteobacteria bacterium LSUCC0684]
MAASVMDSNGLRDGVVIGKMSRHLVTMPYLMEETPRDVKRIAPFPFSRLPV